MNLIKLIIITSAILIIKNCFGQIGPVNFIDSTFTTSGVSMLASADLDNDGDEEIIASFTGGSGKLAYFENMGNGLFSNTINNIDSISFTSGVAVGDFNQDGWKDLVAIGGINHESWVYINNSGTFPLRETLDSNISILVNDVVVADFDLDNDDDIVIIGQHSIDLYRNDGNSNFTKEIILDTGSSNEPLECLDLATADMDSDGDMDLVCAETAGVVVYMNSGNAIFTPNYYSVIAEVGWVIHPFDLDNDNDIDVLMKNSSGDVKWFSNDGTGTLTFEQILTTVPDLLSMKSIDFNNDGYEDIYASYLHHVSIFLNDPNHSFDTEIPIYSDNGMVMGPVHLANIDNWGMQDYIWVGVTKSIAYHLNQLETLSYLDLHDNNLIVFPNPSSDYLEVQGKQAINSIQLYSINGNLIEINFSENNKVDLRNLQNGIYILKINVNGTYITRKIIKN